MLYDAAHRALRLDLLDVLVPGVTRCRQDFPDGTICGRPMYATQRLHLGHTRDGDGYIGLVHASCNDRAAQLWAQWRRANGVLKPKPRIVPRGRRVW